MDFPFPYFLHQLLHLGSGDSTISPQVLLTPNFKITANFKITIFQPRIDPGSAVEYF